MLHKTPAIVFKYFKYGDTSIIAKIFTAKFGLQTYIVNGVRSRRARNKIALYQPLTLLDLVVYHHPNKDINRISEIKCSEPYSSVNSQIQKSAMAIFLAEIMYKSIKEEGEVNDLFDFIKTSIIFFDHLTDHFQNFHLQFLLKLSKYLGFAVEMEDPSFNSLSPEEKRSLIKLATMPYEEKIALNNDV
ncbi:DNA repair protein RecO, partial [Fulvivirga sp. RKSG066]|uniref:DNA repair protein RecO n=1 Tax=Fulvivirga aurantia TaxID=2529383 RepID=UPI0012BBC0C2